MRVYGLSGGIACGKSTVARLLRDAGIPVFDADQAARTVVEPGRPALDAIVAAFGTSVLTPGGELDRAALAEVVFHDEDARKRLEAITHPAIRAEIGRQVLEAAGAGHDVAVVDAALMVETGWYQQFAGLVIVWCPARDQAARLMARDGVGPEDAESRIAAQMPIDEKRDLADFVVDNSGPPEALPAQVEALVAWLQTPPASS